MEGTRPAGPIPRPASPIQGARSARWVGGILLGLLLSLAFTLPWQVPASPRGEEATFLMMVESLWHDQNLRYDPVDLGRAYQHWNGGPTGLRLGEGAGEGWFYALPVVPALVALPFYGVFGPAGLSVLGVLLLGVMFLAARSLVSSRRGEGLALVFLLASALPAYALRLESTLVTAALAFLPLVLWIGLRRPRGPAADGRQRGWRLSPAQRAPVAVGAGGLLGAASTVEPLLLLLALIPVADALLPGQGEEEQGRREGRPAALLAAFLVGLLVTVGLVGALQRKGTGEWRPAVPERSAIQTFHGPFPLEPLFQQVQPSSSPPRSAGDGRWKDWDWQEWRAGAALLPAGLQSFLVGRYTGALPYFPMAFLALGLFLLGSRPRWRVGWWILGVVAAYAVLLLLRSPEAYHGGVGAFGDRGFAVIYPALLLLILAPGTDPMRRGGPILLAVASLAALLWTVPAVVSSWSAPATDAQRHVRTAAFQALPLEVPLAVRGALEDFWVRAGGDALWLLPRHAFFGEEGNPRGVWMRGGSEGDVLVVTPEPRQVLAFAVQGVSAENAFTLKSDAGAVEVRFDSVEKRRSTPIQLPLGPGAAMPTGGGTVEGGRVYRLHARSSDGLVPRRWDRKNGDDRYLGTFLAFGEPSGQPAGETP